MDVIGEVPGVLLSSKSDKKSYSNMPALDYANPILRRLLGLHIGFQCLHGWGCENYLPKDQPDLYPNPGAVLNLEQI